MNKALNEQFTFHNIHVCISEYRWQVEKKTLRDMVDLWIWEDFLFEKRKHNWMIVLLLELTFWYLIPCFQQSIPPFPPFIPHPLPLNSPSLSSSPSIAPPPPLPPPCRASTVSLTQTFKGFQQFWARDGREKFQSFRIYHHHQFRSSYLFPFLLF